MLFKCIRDFCKSEMGELYSEIDHSVDNVRREGLQKGAWDAELCLLQKVFKSENCSDSIKDGFIAFEYTIPRLGKRPDVLLLIQGIIFVLEFKVGETSANKSQINQAVGYAEALKYFHSMSRERYIIPILVATESKPKQLELKIKENKISQLVVCNSKNLLSVIEEILNDSKLQGLSSADKGWEEEWISGQYDPHPSIIEATLKHYDSHEVKDIRESGAQEIATETTNYIIDKIKETKDRNEKAIFFVTGVPGAGKTLVGLEVVSKTHKDYSSVFLSGNDPLVKVLSKALEDDAKKQASCAKKIDRSDSGDMYKPTSMVQLIHGYRKETVNKIEKVTASGKLILKENAKPEVEHVVIFDEAQRAWTRQKLQSPDRSGKWTVLQHENFPYSEPGFLIWSVDQHNEWAVIICLVGGGQEINTGEAGITEWVRSLKQFPHWKVYMPKELEDKEYGGKELKSAYNELENEKEQNQKLHLPFSRRSIRSEKVSLFIKQLLDGDMVLAQQTYASFKNDYPIFITRDLTNAKRWIREQQAKRNPNESYQRAGMLMSSKAFRMRPYGCEIKVVGVYDKVANWFLEDVKNVESSDFLEVALSEFFVQGLELDWTIVMWDADFRAQYDDNNFKGWEYYGSFNGIKWGHNNSQQTYQLNAYRVLLTRARRGMIIFVPKGDKDDSSRNPDFYNSTYNYLRKLGIEDIDAPTER